MKLADSETIVRIYYSYTEIGNAEIKELFSASGATITKKKKEAREAMVQQDKFTFDPKSVNTKIAFEVWGIDIQEHTQNLKKLRSLKL